MRRLFVALATPLVAVLVVLVQKLYVEDTLEKGTAEEAEKEQAAG